MSFRPTVKAQFLGLQPSVTQPASMGWLTGWRCPDRSPGRKREIAHSYQIVSRQCQGEHPIDQRDPAMAYLAQPADRLEPPKDLLDPFALALTERVSRVARGTLVDDTGWFAGEMRRYMMVAHFLHQGLAVVTFVSAQGNSLPAWNLLHHRNRRLGFGAAAG